MIDIKDPKLFSDENILEEILDAAPDPIIIVYENGQIAMANAETTRKFGYESFELNGSAVDILLPERFRARHALQRQDYNQRPRLRPMGQGLELFASRKDGSEFPVEISLSPLKTVAGQLVICIVRDITERKMAEKALQDKAQELARSNAELEQFAYVASHDLQEPLRAIAGSCQLLQKRLGDKLDDASQTYVGFAIDGAKRMQALITDLLDYSKVTTKAKPFESVSCDSIVKQVLASLSAQISETGAIVKYDKLPDLHADASQLGQVFQNLINNAIKFRGNKRPEISIAARRGPTEWIFSVCDNGIGIEEEYFERVFVIFRRLHTREEYQGTGIGLAVCKKIVERHGGKMWVESKLGEGSVFYFSIPAN